MTVRPVYGYRHVALRKWLNKQYVVVLRDGKPVLVHHREARNAEVGPLEPLEPAFHWRQCVDPADISWETSERWAARFERSRLLYPIAAFIRGIRGGGFTAGFEAGEGDAFAAGFEAGQAEAFAAFEEDTA